MFDTSEIKPNAMKRELIHPFILIRLVRGRVAEAADPAG